MDADGNTVDADAQTYSHGVIKWVSTFVVRGIPLQHAGKAKIIKERVSVTGSTGSIGGLGWTIRARIAQRRRRSGRAKAP